MNSRLSQGAAAVSLAFLATSARAEASYEAAGQAFAVLIFWAIIAVVLFLAAVASCIQRKSAIPLVAPAVFVASAIFLTQLVIAALPILPDSQATFWCAAIAISLTSIASALFAVSKLMRDSSQSNTPQALHAVSSPNTLPKAASKAERLRLIATLNTLRCALTEAISALPNTDASKGEFSNAASDLLCQARLLASAHLDDLAAHVERVLVKWQHESLDVHDANHLLSVMNAEIGRLE